MAQTLRVDGLRDLLAVTDLLPKHTRREIRDELRQVAVPVRDRAQQLFLSEVSDDQRKTRYGITVRKVGTISVEQRVKGKNRAPQYRRPKFTTLVRERSLLPGLEQSEDKIMAGFNNVLDSLERRWAV